MMKIWNFYDQRQKIKFLQLIAYFESTWGPQMGSYTRKYFSGNSIWLNMNASWKFEATKIKDWKFEILTIWTNFESPWGTQMDHYIQKYYIDNFI